MSERPPPEGGGTRVETFTHVLDRTRTRTVSYVVSQSLAVECYIHEDLEHIVAQRGIDLQDLLGVPSWRRTYSNERLMALICDDVGHMLRDALISRVHFLLHEPGIDARTRAYPLYYHASYEIRLQRGLRDEAPQRHGDLPTVSERIPAKARFAILLEWDPDVTLSRRQTVVRPAYNLDWVAPTSRYDGTTLVRYRSGGLTVDGAVIVTRREDTTPHALGGD